MTANPAATAPETPDAGPDQPVQAETLPGECSPDQLRTLFLFEKLTEEQLQRLCQEGHVERLQPGVLFAEGAPADCFYVLIEGTLVTSRRVGPDDVEVGRTSQRGVYTGAYTAYLGDRVPQVYQNTVRVTEPSKFFVLGASCFAQVMTEWFPMPTHLLEGLWLGGQRSREAVGQRERLLALGSLTAGLTHELNNPAAAAVRATVTLRERVAAMRGKLKMLAAGKYEKASFDSIIELQQRAVERVAKAPKLAPLEASDLEDEMSDWLDENGIRDGWQLSPTFVQAGLRPEWLDQVRDMVGDAMLEPALRWLNYTVETELLMNEIEDATTRISTLVGDAKQYSQLDRAPFQVVDVHDLLDSTLLMMSAKIGASIKVVKDYDRSLPRPARLRVRAEPGLDQHDRQRGVGHGRDGHADHTHRPGRRLRADRDRRHRARHPGRHQEPDFRAVLQHQAGRRGDRPRARHRLADRGQQAPRRPAGRVRPR